MGLLVLAISTNRVFAQSVNITQSGGSTNVSETGPTSDTYTIVLGTQPTDSVEIVADPDTQLDLGFGPGTAVLLTFTTSDWDVPQTITVTAVDDAQVEGVHASTIVHAATSADADYDGIAVAGVTTAITDNDSASVIITETGGSTIVSETGPTADSYTVTLGSKPSANVIITVDPDVQTDLGFGAGVALSLSFAPATWNLTRTIIVTAVDDANQEGPHTSTITHTAVSADTNYDGIGMPDIVASIIDNDAAGVTLLETDGSTDVSEIGPSSDTYTVSLDRAPANDVTITATPDAQTDLGAGAGVAITLVFTTVAWDVTRNVTVTATDDAAPEGPHTSTITHTASSADADYDGIAISNIVAHVADDDLFGVSIVESGGSTTINEFGPTSDTYTIALDSPPTDDVDVLVDPDEQTDVGAGAGTAITLIFTTANWSTPQTVTVTAFDDDVSEGAHTSTITHSASSTDARYDGLAIVEVTANLIDDDTAGVAITELGGSTNVSEAGPSSDTYTIVLESEPTADVTITVSPDAQTDLGSGAGAAIVLTFTAADWDMSQTVTVTAEDDDVAEGAHTSTITHTASSADTIYDGISVNDVTANVTDNDAVGVTVSESGGTTDVNEAGPTSDAYTIVLDSEPTEDVTITVDPDAQTDLGNGSGATIVLTFTAGDWDTPQTVTVTAEDDAASEGLHTSTITHAAASTDAAYDGIAISNVVANVTDNDLPGVTLAETGGSTDVGEAGPTSDTYTVVLDSPPTAPVTITTDPDAQVDLGAGPGTAVVLTFHAGNWNTPQILTVTAVDDDVAEGAHNSTITHSAASADADYNGIAIADVDANIADDDAADVFITESDGSTDVEETGATSDTYTIVLGSEPVANVTITVTPDIQTDLGAGAGTAIVLTFTSGDWDSAQTVTVTAVDDGAPEGPHTSTITHTAASADADFDGIAISDLVVNVTDDDLPGVTITASGAGTDVDETGPTADTYTVVLDSEPVANVTVTVDPDAQVDLGAGQGTSIDLTFTAGDWDTPQTVTVTAVDDDVVEGPHTSTITHTATSADGDYDGIAINDLTANVGDNDTAGVIVTESGAGTDIDETGPTADTYTIVLDSEPVANVTITVDPDTQVDLGAGQGTPIDLTFTAGDWDTPHTVTVTAVDDDVVEGPHTSTITHAATSADGEYDGIAINDLTANIGDNDTAGVTVTESGPGTDADETGPTADTYTIVLDSEPVANVTVTVDPDTQVDLGAGQGTPVDLTFTAGDWDTPQTVTVTAVDDDVAEGPHTSTITHAAASADGEYDGIAINDLTANIGDNDTAGVTITASGAGTDVDETGPTADTYTVVLDSEPVANVTITVDPDTQVDLGAGQGTPLDLTFTAGDWDTPQTVTVTAVDDDVVEGLHTSTITHAAASADGEYDGVAINDLTANIGDNDTAGVTITESGAGTDVDETGPTADTYTIVLDSEPVANVIIIVVPDAQVDLGAGQATPVNLTFTAGNWDTPQTVTVTAVDDGVVEGLHAATITHTAASTDANYDGIGIGNVAVTLRDRAGVTISESGGATIVSEDGPTADTYTIVLNSQPAADVTVFVDPDSQVDMGAGAATAILLTFTPANWNTAQTATVTAVDDAVVEGSHTSTINHFAVSSDPTYDGIGISNVSAGVIDNDIAPPPSGGGVDSTRELVARDQTLVIDEDTAIDLTLSASGRLGSSPEFLIVQAPRYGVLHGNAPLLTYVPAPDVVGIDSFVFIVARGDTASTLGTVSIEILPVPDVPRGSAQELTVKPGETLGILLYGFDPDEGDVVAFEIVEPPAHGTLTGTPPVLTYVPDTDFLGRDTLAYVVTDGVATSEPEMVTIVVADPSAGGGDDDGGSVGELIADAGDYAEVLVGQPLLFDGSGSYIHPGEAARSDSTDARIILYAWDFDTADISDVDATGLRVDWVFDHPGEYVVTLRVFDSLGRRAQDTVVCTVIENATDGEIVDPNVPPHGSPLCGVLGWANIGLMFLGLGGLRTRNSQNRD